MNSPIGILGNGSSTPLLTKSVGLGPALALRLRILCGSNCMELAWEGHGSEELGTIWENLALSTGKNDDQPRGCIPKWRTWELHPVTTDPASRSKDHDKKQMAPRDFPHGGWTKWISHLQIQENVEPIRCLYLKICFLISTSIARARRKITWWQPMTSFPKRLMWAKLW